MRLVTICLMEINSSKQEPKKLLLFLEVNKVKNKEIELSKQN